MGEGGVAVHRSLDQVFQALGGTGILMRGTPAVRVSAVMPGLWRHSSVITVTPKENPMAGRACAVPVRLTIKRRRKLEQIVAAGQDRAGGRAANAQIARDLGCCVPVVRTWRRRFAVRGIAGFR